jgi:hypothetical protein
MWLAVVVCTTSEYRIQEEEDRIRVLSSGFAG